MRRGLGLVLLTAVLATGCDQGAIASPPEPAVRIESPAPPPQARFAGKYEVRDDQDFIAKAIVLLEEMFQIFDTPNLDCEVMATLVEEYGGRNVTRFAVLTAYGKAHPGVEKELQKQFEPQLDELVQKLTTTLSPCMQNQRLMKAFEKLSHDVNAPQWAQRPR